MSSGARTLIQADDLTGAADTAVAFAAAGERTVVLPWTGGAVADRLERALAELEPVALALDCASRDLDAGEAARRARELASTHGAEEPTCVYKKVDSVLRGHPAAELHALLEGLGAARSVVIAPAYPALGRTTIDARQLVDGRPLAGPDLPSLFELDPASVRLVSLAELRSGLVLDERPGFAVVDADLTEDLDLLAAALERLERLPLLVGSGGLAAAVAARRRYGAGETDPCEPPSGRRLVVSVSRTAAAVSQLERLGELLPELVDARISVATLARDERAWLGEVERAAALVRDALETGADVLLGVAGAAPEELGSAATRDLINDSLERTLAGALSGHRPDLIVASGADSALAVCAALGVEALVVERALPHGAVQSATYGRPDPPLAIVTKSGGFGGPEALAELCGALRPEPARSGAR